MQDLTHYINNIKSHKALNNGFYTEWMTKQWPIEYIALFARNYWEFSWNFPKVLAELIIHTTDNASRLEYTKILYSELGYGQKDKIHSHLFEEFLTNLSEKMGRPHYLSLENLQKNFPLLQTTTQLIEGEKKLYSENLAVGAGAQLALECQAYLMISQLYEGARNYMNLWSNISSFHESCEFFYIHIGSAEKDHREQALTAIHSIIKYDPQLTQQAIYGFNKHLELFANFWDGLLLAIKPPGCSLKVKAYSQGE